MYFGDYLLEKKILNSDQLLKALCYQLENLPSMIRIVWESNVVSSSEMFNLIKKQINDDTDILTILKNEKKVDDNKINELILLQMSKKMPLGEILVKLNFSDLNTINSALKDFYDNKFNIKEETAPVTKAETAQKVEISEAALESLRELGMSMDEAPTSVSVNFVTPKPFVDQYLDLFSEKFRNKLKKLIDILNTEVTGTSDISNYYNSLYRDLHLLRGSVTLSELKSQDEIISVWENQIEKVLVKSNDDIREWCKRNLGLLSNTVDLLWSARIVINRDKSDENISKDENFLMDISSILDKIF